MTMSDRSVALVPVASARTLKCDMYLPRSIDSIVGDKLYESSEEISKGQRNTRNLVRRLELKTAFPDIRKHVNSDRIDFNEVLRIRRYSQTRRFRRFLRTAPPSEQDALNAYLYESAQAAGFSRIPKRVWPLLTIAAAATGSAIGSSVSLDPASGSLVGGLLGGSASYLVKTAAAFAEWRPKIFGDWYGTEIAKLLKKTRKK